LNGKEGSHHFKRTFFTGLAALLPTVLSIIIVVVAANFIYRYISVPAGNGFAWVFNKFADESDAIPSIPDRNAREQEPGKYPPSIWLPVDVAGFILAIVAIYFLGLFLAGRLAGRLWQRIERLLSSLPIFKAVYPYVKQFTDFVFREKRLAFQSVVAVQYFRKGVYSVGFLTAKQLRKVNEAANDELVSVFIPSTPWPATGFTVFVPKSEVVFLEMSVDQAFRLVITGGVVVPDDELVAAAAVVGSSQAVKTADEPPVS